MIDLGLDLTVLLLRVSSPRIASATFGGLSGVKDWYLLMGSLA